MKTRLAVNFFLTLMLSQVIVKAQSRKVDKNYQYWIGYMTTTSISDKYSLWNDFHYVPESFVLVRTGLTRRFQNTSVTAGYAFLWLSPGNGNTNLIRHEQRPWAQIQFNLPVSGQYSLIQRIRYDARFRENVSKGEVTDGYSFNHRVRFLISLKRTLSSNPDKEVKPFVVLSNEVLINFGKEVTTNTFDQNRLAFSFGLQTARSQYQLGVMDRFVQTGPTKFTANYTLVFWITQKFDLKNFIHRREHAENIGE